MGTLTHLLTYDLHQILWYVLFSASLTDICQISLKKKKAFSTLLGTSHPILPLKNLGLSLFLSFSGHFN